MKVSKKKFDQVIHILQNARVAQQFLLKDSVVLCEKSKFKNKNIYVNAAANDTIEPINKLMGSRIALFHAAVHELEQFAAELRV